MSTFYLLPPRPVLGERFARYLETLFPGLDWSSAAWPELAETLGTLAAQRSDIYVVYADELPPGDDPAQALAAGFGAEVGDEVIEIQPESKLGEGSTRRWRLDRVIR